MSIETFTGRNILHQYILEIMKCRSVKCPYVYLAYLTNLMIHVLLILTADKPLALGSDIDSSPKYHLD